MDEWPVDNIFEAAQNGFNRQVLRFIREGQDVNSTESSYSGYTPLFGAVFGGHIDTVRLLLQHGANEYIRDSLGYTALDQAYDEGRYNIAELIKNNVISSPNSIPSDPDYELMKNQAATQIQRRMRGRQLRQNRNYTRRNTGLQSFNPNRRERFRRFTDHNRMLDENDPLSGYLHDVYFPPKKSSSKSSSKHKVAKKKRNRKNRY